MLHAILGLFIAFTITFIAIPRVLRISLEKNLVDIPDDLRKLHNNPIPSLGGVAIVCGFIVAGLLSSSSVFEASTNIMQSQYLAAGFLVLFFAGVVDDIVEISPTKKLIAQMIAAFIFYYKLKLEITGLHGIFGITDNFPDIVGVGFTFFTIIVITNAFNLIDGIDGLAGSLSLITCLCFGIYFLSVEQYTEGVWALSMIGSLIAFLIYNHHPAKIFMGDTGSLTIGLLNSYLAIRFIEIADKPAIAELGAIKIVTTPVMAMSILAVPLLDTLRVFAIRIFNGRSPFSPDRNHVHHLLADVGMSHNKITLYLVLANAVIIAGTYFAQFILPPTLLMFIVIAVSMLAIGFLFEKRKMYMRLQEALQKEEDKSDSFIEITEPKLIKYIRKAMIEN
jgi:UDP-GlcNAc:undecaprenyl-phosphate/decaprenyl-phosphate GlcNAc-1-phosphate transferase